MKYLELIVYYYAQARLVVLLDAFINAILNAPVKLVPSPRRMAKAGTKIIDATINPVPISKELFLGLFAFVPVNS